MSQATTHSSPPTRPALGGNLRAKLGAVRRKLVRVEVTRRLSISISIGLLGLVALLGADWFMEFSLETRSALLLALGIMVTLFLLRALIALATQRRDEESIALMVEKNTRAARLLGMSRATFYRRLDEYGIKPSR